ncbi:MAG: NUDIX hydrolase [Candidatus Pacebacteria bacterium]|nr:NUDIX hydrolase [Candidatus Paceibacterota bacterium]
MEKHQATIGVFFIPPNSEGKGLWSVRADGKGINAIGGQVDPEDIAKGLSLTDVLKREAYEEAGIVAEITDDRPLGIFPNAGIKDVAILYPGRIVSGEPNPSKEAIEHLWMDPYEVRHRAEMYDLSEAEHARGLLSGVGKRQWNMAKTFFLNSFNPEYRLSALYNLAPQPRKSGNKPGTVVIYNGAAYMVIGVKGRWRDPNLVPTEGQFGIVPDWVDNPALKTPPGYEKIIETWNDTGEDMWEHTIIQKI